MQTHRDRGIALSGFNTTPSGIIRLGGVVRGEIERVIGPVKVMDRAIVETEAPRSPGQSAVHYAPRTPAYRFETAQRGKIPVELGGAKCGLVVVSPLDVVKKWENIVALSCRPEVYARHLYEVLRELDAMDLAAIFIEMPPDRPEWAAVRDRITRATEQY